MNLHRQKMLRLPAALASVLAILCWASPVWASECAETIRTVVANETRLHYFDCGQGAPVVLVHGSTGSLNSLAGLAQSLSPDFRVVAYSRRYHFPNAPPQAGDRYALEQHVDDLTALFAALELGSAHVVGHSYGGYVALAFALEHPARVDRLVLGEPPVLPLLSRTAVGEAMGESFRREVIDPSRAAYEQGDMAGGIRRFLDGVIYEGWFGSLPPERQQAIVETAGPEHRLEVLSDPAIYMPPLDCAAMSRLGRPTLLLAGEDSDVRFLLITAMLESCLEDESFALVPDVGHGMFSNVEFTSSVIRDFLSR